MNRQLLFPVLFAALAITILFSGCKKYVHQNIQAASNSSVAIIAYNDVFEQLNLAVDSPLDQKTIASWKLSGTICANVTLSPVGTVFPKTLTIDYGTGCTGPEGKVRSGKIVAEFSGNFLDESSIAVLNFDNFSTGQYKLSGTHTITNTGVDASGNFMFTEALRNAVLSWGDQTIRWKADLVRTWTEGAATNFIANGAEGVNDDVFLLSGSATGNDSNTHPFTLEITTPLVLQTGCKYIKEGILSIFPANFNEGKVDYGTGTCDKQATMEVDGEVFNFTM